MKAAVELVLGKSAFPSAQFGQIGQLAERIAPAVRRVEPTTAAHELMSRATVANTLLTAAALQRQPPILQARVRDRSLLVIAARYDIETGRVALL